MANREENKYLICDQERPKVAMAVKVVLGTVNNILDRRDRIRNRNTKLALLVDQLCMSMDTLNGAAETLPEQAGFDRELCEQIRTTVGRMRNAMNELFEYVQDPHAEPAGAPVVVNHRN